MKNIKDIEVEVSEDPKPATKRWNIILIMFALFLLLTGLKIMKVITFSWWFVFSPLMFVMVILITVIVTVLYLSLKK